MMIMAPMSNIMKSLNSHFPLHSLKFRKSALCTKTSMNSSIVLNGTKAPVHFSKAVSAYKGIFSLSKIPAFRCPGFRRSSFNRRETGAKSLTRSIHISCCTAQEEVVPDGSVSAILLAGGVGKRMGANIPKQYIEIHGEAIATYSLSTLSGMREIGEIVIVCEPTWRYIFEDFIQKKGISTPITWALPGDERQDSVFNGLQAAREGAELVAMHDSARPLVNREDIERCLADAWTVGAAVLGVRVKPTIKEVRDDLGVVRTVPRANLWEVQSPQVIRTQLLKEGYELVKQKGLEVTDDVSIVEAMGLEVKLTEGSYTNLKVTTPEDLSVAAVFLDEKSKVSITA